MWKSLWLLLKKLQIDLPKDPEVLLIYINLSFFKVKSWQKKNVALQWSHSIVESCHRGLPRLKRMV